MTADVWWSAGISIPISFAVALAVPNVQKRLAEWGQSSHAKKLNRVKSEYFQVLQYALKTDLMLGRLVVALIVLVDLALFLLLVQPLGLAMGDALSLLWPAPKLPGGSARVILAVGSLSVLISLWVAALVATTRYTAKYSRIFFNVSNFVVYVESVPKEIRDIEMETVIICAARDRAYPGLESLKQQLRKSLKADAANSSAESPEPNGVPPK